jgi:hypothetical protein
MGSGAVLGRPYGLVSLCELMYKFNVAELASLVSELAVAGRLASIVDMKNPGCTTPEAAVKQLTRCFEKLQAIQGDLQLDHALRTQIYMHIKQIEKGTADLRANALQVAISSVYGALLGNLSTRFFLFVPADKAKHYQNAEMFGAAVVRFPEAIEDMSDAGTCYAANLPAACVFHLMRVAEFGLRALARKLNVSLRDKGKPCHIEYATWNKVLEGVDTKIKKLRAKSAGAKKNEELQFYSDAAEHCRHVRDIWRNEVSHTRTRYNEHEAFAAMNRISDFMQLLALGPNSLMRSVKLTIKVNP